MESVFFARFPERTLAAKFLHDVRAGGRKVEVQVVGQQSVKSGQSLPLVLSNVRSAVWKGLLGGAAGGLLLGGLAWAFGFANSAAPAALFGVVLGAIAGMLGAVLIGTSDPDQNLEKTVESLAPGEVVLSFAAADRETDEALRREVKDLGAEVIQAAGLHPLDQPTTRVGPHS